MSRKIKPATAAQVDAAAETLRLLRLACAEAHKAESPRTLARIRLAITSAGGALRHAENRAFRTEHPRT